MQNNLMEQETLLDTCCDKIVGYLKPVLILLGESENTTSSVMHKLAERFRKEEETVLTYFADENAENGCSESLMNRLIYDIEVMCGITEHFREPEEEGMRERIIPSPVAAYRQKYYEYKNAYNDSKANYLFSLLDLRAAEGYVFIEVPETMIFREYMGEVIRMFANRPETNLKMILSYTGSVELEELEKYLEEYPAIEIGRIPAEPGDGKTESIRVSERKKKELTFELVKEAYDTRSEVLLSEIKEMIFRAKEGFIVFWLITVMQKLTEEEKIPLHWLIKKLAAHEKTQELSAQMKAELLNRYETETGSSRTTEDAFRLADFAIETGLLWENAYRKEEGKRCYKKAWDCLDELYKKRSTTQERCNLIRFYGAMAAVMNCPSNNKEDGFFERARECLAELSRDAGFGKDLRRMSEYYLYVGKILGKDRAEEAMAYFIKAVLLVQKEYMNDKATDGLSELAQIYWQIGESIKRWGYDKYADAATYFEKSLNCIKKVYEVTGNKECLNDLAEKYMELGGMLHFAADVLQDAKLETEILKYDREAVVYAKKWHEMTGTEASFSGLLQRYCNLRYTYKKLEKWKEEMLCANEVVRLCRDAYMKFRTEELLTELAEAFQYLGNCLYTIGRTEEADLYFNRATEIYEEMRERVPK